jgi:cytochrome c55X
MVDTAPILAAWIVVLGLAGAAAAAEPGAERRAELVHLLRHDCGACHGITLKGGLGPSLLPARLGEISDEALIETMLDGRRGTPMPPWRPFMSRDEALWLVHRLKEGVDGVD